MKLEHYLPQMRRCSACGQCLGDCPVYNQSKLETDSPRGKLAVARAIAEEKISLIEALEPISRCTLCGRCSQVCAQALPLEDIFFAARSRLGKLLPAKYRQLFLAMTRFPQVWDFCQPPLHLLQKLKTNPFPAVAFKTFRRPDLNEGKVLLFSGCLARRFFPELVDDCVTALNENGFSVIFPFDQVCCGRPQAAQGSGISSAVRRNLRMLSKHKFDWIVSPCPGCIATIRHLWGSLPELNKDEKSLITRLGAISIDINLLLMRAGAKGQDTSCFWHSPCLLTGEGIEAAKTLAGINSSFSEEPTCCGEPLNLLATREEKNRLEKIVPTVQRSLQENLRLSILNQGQPSTPIATACPGCMLALRDTAPVRHSIQLYVSSL